MAKKNKILYRIYFLGFFFIGALLFLFFQMFRIQVSETVAEDFQEIKYTRVPSLKGNIYSYKGDLLVSSVVKYELRFDPLTVDEYYFEEFVDQLADSLSHHFGKSKDFYQSYLNTAREKGNRYLLIGKDLSYFDYQKIKSFPIFNLGVYRGGLIVQSHVDRRYPWSNMAYRTLGYEKIGPSGANLSVGIEGGYGHRLRGIDGFQLRQKIGKKQWKPIESNSDIEPVQGQDVYITLDPFIQEVTHQKLIEQLKAYDAAYGVAVVMETESGKIRSISNLTRHKGKYRERYNYAVGQLQEPGSTFKLMSYVAALEDRKITPNSIISTGKGKYDIQGFTVRDTKRGGYGMLNASKAFAVSSNIATVKLIEKAYAKDPLQFINRLHLMGVDKELGLAIKGEAIPKIPHPKDASWSKISLSWMSYGYGVMMTPLQILSFYNAIANDGKMVKPQFVEKIVSHDGIVTYVDKEVLNPSVCSKRTVKQVKAMMERVVNEGTAKSIQLSYLPMAGKTGTVQKRYWRADQGDMGYISSFVGYFPSDDPKYTCIVVVTEPDKSRGYYGSEVAAPVFKEIAKMVYPRMIKQDTVTLQSYQNTVQIGYQNIPKTEAKKMPSVLGMSIMDAMPLLENMGVSVRFTGSGTVIKQSVKKGTILKHYTTVYLELS